MANFFPKPIPLLLLIATCVASGYLVAVMDDQIQWTFAQASLVVGLGLLCAFPFVVALSRKRIDIFEPVFMFAIVFALAFLVSSILMILEDYVDRTGIRATAQLAQALTVACVGLCGLYVGYYFSLQKIAPHWAARLVRISGSRRVSSKVLLFFSIAGLIMSFAAFFGWFSMARIPLSYLNALDESVLYNQAGQMAQSNIFFLYAFRLAWPGLILLAWYTTPNRFWKFVLFVLWLASLVVYLLAANRNPVFVLLISTAASAYLVKEKRPNVLALVLAVSMIAVLSSALLISRGGDRPDLNLRVIVYQTTEELTDRGALAGLLNTTEIFPERHDHVGMIAVNDIIYTPIPRIFWPDKPNLRPLQEIIDLYLPTTVGQAFGMLGLFYAGYGLLGAFGVMFLLGVMSAIVYRVWSSSSNNIVLILTLAVWLPLVWEMIHREPFSKLLVNLFFYLGPMWLAWLAARFFTKQ